MEKYLQSNERDRPRVFGVGSVSEFVELATWLHSSDEVIFRGQTKEDGWPLVPSIGRHHGDSRFSAKERDLLDDFKRVSIPYVEHVPANDWQWLALAQHNGLPTRLLDWEQSLVVARRYGSREAG